MSLLFGALLLVTGYTDSINPMANGQWVHPGAAACPPSVAFGTQLVVDGVGLVVCEDRYSRALGPRIDVYCTSREQAYAITGMRAVWVVDGQ